MKHKLHRALALGLGGLIALWISAGCLLLWQEDIQHPSYALSSDTSKAISLTQALAVAQSRHLEPGSWCLRPPFQAGEAIRAIFLADDLFAEANEPIVLWIDPKTGELLAEAEAKSPFWQGLYRFHARLWLGEKGNAVVLAFGLALAGILMSGILLWRTSRALNVRTLHRWLGIGIVPLLAISLTSGLLLSLPAGWLSGPSPQTVPVHAVLNQSPTADEIAFWAKQRFPDLNLRELVLPENQDEPWELALYRPGTLDVEPAWVRVWVDAKHNRARVQEPSAAWRERFRQWVYVLHTGQVAGKIGQLALSVGGVGFLVQAALGVVLWLRRRRRLAARSPAAHRKQQIA